MRARFVLGLIGCVAIGLTAPWACIPHPDQDFKDYQGRIASFPTVTVEASTFEAAPPPAQADEGLYYGACFSELALNQTKNVFNFYTNTKYTPDSNGGGKLSLTIEALVVVNRAPPPTIAKAGVVGPPIPTPEGTVTPAGKFELVLGTVTIPGEANPISGSNVLIEGTTLKGLFGEEKFCARLGGEVKQPAGAARTLNEAINICQFVKIQDGATTPTFTLADFQTESCPL